MPGALIGEFYFLDQIAQAFACTDPHASVRIERHRREGEDADFHRCQSSAVAEGIASLASKSLVSPGRVGTVGRLAIAREHPGLCVR